MQENDMRPCPACNVSIGTEREICPHCLTDIEEGVSFIPYVNMPVFTTEKLLSIDIEKELGIVFGNSSIQAFWGLSTQANRLTRGYEAALLNLKYNASKLGADAVIGVSFALNNSTGSGATIITGSSEAVMLLGTAVTISKA